jgi:glucuronate isomerase
MDLVVRQPSYIIRRMRTQGVQCRTITGSREHYADILAYVKLFWRLDGNNADADIRSELVSDDVVELSR